MSLARVGADSVDGLEVGVGGRQDLLQAAELVDDLLDDKLGDARDPAQHAVAARGDREVEGVELAVVAEQLGEAAEVEHVLVRQPRERLQHRGQVLLGVLDRVVADQRRLVGGDADHRLLELHLDQPALGAELDDVALDLDRHPGHQLGPLQHRERVVEDAAALELEHGQPGRDLVEARAVLVERRQALVRLGEHRGDVLEDVLGPLDVERDDVAALGDRDHQRVGLLGDALGGAVAGAGLGREDRRVGHQLDVGPGDLGRLGVEDDRAVHLRHLVEHRRRVVDVELDPAGEQVGDVLGVADDDQAAGPRVDDVVDPLAQRRPGGDDVEGPQQPGVLTFLQLLKLIPGGPRSPSRLMLAKKKSPRVAAISVWIARIKALSSGARWAVAAARAPRRRAAPPPGSAATRGPRALVSGAGPSTGPSPNLRASATRRSAWAT